MERFLRFSFLLFGLFLWSDMHAQDEFITVWKTDNPGDSEDDQIILSSNGFFYDIYWEEVINPSNNGSLIGDFDFTTITFPNPGMNTIVD